MARYRGTVATARPPEEVFEYLANFSTVAEWDPGVKEAYSVNAAGVRRGARFKVVSRFLGRDIPLTYRIVELDRPRRVLLEADGDSVLSRDEITVRSLPDGGSVVTYDADLRLKGKLRVAELPMRVLFRRIGERARSGLEGALA